MNFKSKINQNTYLRMLLGILTCVMLLTIFGTAQISAKDRKYGLFIGINDYPGDDGDLNGAVNDAKGWQSAMIANFKFQTADTKLLLDAQATRQNIIASINSFAAKATRGDLLVVTYSGHGTLFPDQYSEEIDEKKMTGVDLWFGSDHYTMPKSYYDSAICPFDSDSKSSGKSWGNLILDDELFNLFSPVVAKGAKVVFISDSCHSGTIARGESKDIQAKPRIAPLTRFFKAKTFSEIKFKTPATQKNIESRAMNGLYLTMSGSKDSEVSWDFKSSTGQYSGMFTNTALKFIKLKGAQAINTTYEELMEAITDSVITTTRANFPTTQSPYLNTEYGTGDMKIFQP